MREEHLNLEMEKELLANCRSGVSINEEETLLEQYFANEVQFPPDL